MPGTGAAPPRDDAQHAATGPRRADEHRTLVTLALAAVLAVGGLGAIAAGKGPAEATTNAPRPATIFDRPDAALQPRADERLVAPPAYAPAAPPDGVHVLDRSVPTHLRISRVGIDTDLMELGLNPDHTIEVPPDAPDAPAGWYRNLSSPGQDGPAVILGHLDSPDDKGVFFNLGAVRAGDVVVVSLRDGSTATFTVDMVAAFTRAAFPTAGVYGSTDHPGLRLVTCGGKFSRTDGYEDSVVVFASLTGATSLAHKPSYTWWR